MPTEPTEPRHRYYLEELLGELPPGWGREGEHYLKVDTDHISITLYVFHMKDDYWTAQSLHQLQDYPVPTQRFSTPHAAMAAIDDWLDEYTNA